jgi:hypothetical protein
MRNYLMQNDATLIATFVKLDNLEPINDKAVIKLKALGLITTDYKGRLKHT